MSYLPRMSKTYREPQQQDFKKPEEDLTVNILKPASSLLNDKVYHPQTILKHYRYHPHPLPVLPGPSVLEEAIENEFYREANRLRRSASKMEAISKASETITENFVEVEQNEETAFENESVPEENLKRPLSRKGIKKSKSSLGKRKSAKHLKRENVSKLAINVCLLKTETPFAPEAVEATRERNIGDFQFLNKKEKSASVTSTAAKSPKSKNLMELLQQQTVEAQPKNVVDFSTQCALVGSLSKAFVIPPVVSSLLRTLSFLFREISKGNIKKYEKETKAILIQSQSLLDNLCSEKIDKEYSFDMTYSDFKRLEKIYGELKKYLKDVYGDKSETIDKMEDLKRVFIKLRKKEMELLDLNEKLDEMDVAPKDVILNEKDMKNPEVALQNNRLEREQLLAEVEFRLMELRNYQETLAELDWDIKNCHKQMHSLKKSTSSSKTEMLGRKCSRKFSGDALSKGSRNLESESNNKKKT